jgi:DNA-binding Xre family transcriptional regulator
LAPDFRIRLFKIAREKEGSDAQLGKRLGYRSAPGRRLRELWGGNTKTIDLAKLEKLSKITGIPLKDILEHCEEV